MYRYNYFRLLAVLAGVDRQREVSTGLTCPFAACSVRLLVPDPPQTVPGPPTAGGRSDLTLPHCQG